VAAARARPTRAPSRVGPPCKACFLHVAASVPPSPAVARVVPAPPIRRSGPALTPPQSVDGGRISGPTESAAPRRRLWLITLLLGAITLIGAPYYFAPVGIRVRSPWHAWLKPSGYIGQTAGIISFLIFVALWLYPLRKRFRWLSGTGSMARWLDVHVSLALVLPLLAAVHAGWHFRGLIGLGFDAMLAVWLSGLVGRYLYSRIPRSRTGLELDAEGTARRRRDLLAEIARRSGLPIAEVESLLGEDPWPCEGLGLVGTLRQLIKDDWSRWRATRALARALRRRGAGKRLDRRTLREVRRLARREMALMQQSRLLGATQRLFRFWHVVHRPFAIAALAAVLVHVAVAVAVGMTWLG
jgi:hypothetical protein